MPDATLVGTGAVIIKFNKSLFLRKEKATISLQTETVAFINGCE
ncbi:hypothetical protein AF91_06570 [Lacticaseibacillus paracasei N1115]|uniref:Uncharacterized protein n=1 Tax=Lacticaseibacillus paracasei N1115 TaxID=1446494 RepID=A0A806LIX7_LACPA|nr:hypothetical protein AF91_06570 [Lacticaseibacillus paracasei N1115]